MNQYMLSVHSVAGAPPPDAGRMKKMYADVAELNEKLQKDGAWVFACGLHPASSATVVAMKEGEVLLTDGPFSEAKEHIGGFWIIKAQDLDAAVAWAAKAAVACGAPVEVRPLQEQA
jgi:hypothetical protein